MSVDISMVATDTVVIAGEPPAKTPDRYTLVDALRGVAAIMVVCYHLLISTVMEVPLRHAMPVWVAAVIGFGFRGVEVFFVISGFVIAHSMRRLKPDLSGAGNFILRRQVRLDPPYFLVFVLTLISVAVENRVPGLVHKPMGNEWQWLANLFYLQNILRQPQIVGIAWTLCLEIQFYLVFMAACSIGYFTSPTRKNPSQLARVLVVGSGLICLIAVREQMVSAPWFWSFWPFFVLGVVCHWSTHDLLPTWAMALYGVAFAGVMIGAGSSLMLVGLIAGGLLYVAGRLHTLRTWGRNAVLQYLGRISYSLYLVHILVLSPLLRGGYKLTHDRQWPAIVWYLLALGVSIALADVFHRFVEVPSMRWSAALKPRKRRPAYVPPNHMMPLSAQTTS